MSYILDALNKADQQRQRGTTPTLQSAQVLTASREPRRQWVYAALATALAAAAFAIGSLRPWQTELASVPIPAAAAQPDATPRASTPPIPTAVIVSAGEPRSRIEAPAREASTQKPVTLASIERSRAVPSHSPALEAAAAPVPQAAEPAAPTRRSAERSAAARTAKAADDEVPALAELPASLRSELPAMAISVHAYFPASKDRLVSVNGKLLHEGDGLTSDLVLEKITPDGMIFSYKGTRFRRGLR
jgi:general secretion pathway protein B